MQASAARFEPALNVFTRQEFTPQCCEDDTVKASLAHATVLQRRSVLRLRLKEHAGVRYCRANCYIYNSFIMLNTCLLAIHLTRFHLNMYFGSYSSPPFEIERSLVFNRYSTVVVLQKCKHLRTSRAVNINTDSGMLSRPVLEGKSTSPRKHSSSTNGYHGLNHRRHRWSL